MSPRLVWSEHRERLLAAGAWAAVLALAAWSTWHRWALLTESPYPVGVDGWYYPIQLRSLLERGELAYPAAPLTFWLMAPVAALTDPIVAAKVIAALGGGLVGVPAFLLGRRVGGVAGGLVAAVLATTGGGSFYLSLEFVKNGLGLTVALTAAWLGLRALEQPTARRGALAAGAIVAAVLTHKMSALLALGLLAPAALVELRARRPAALTWRRAAAGAAAGAAGAGEPPLQRMIRRLFVSLFLLAFTGPPSGRCRRWRCRSPAARPSTSGSGTRACSPPAPARCSWSRWSSVA
ncbi:MAG: glycosyltransferase family 39 protein [Kofleriaceae bacterium]|nr:glycosyltransferase family 39 protein [Kofleriaceae bacterium]